MKAKATASDKVKKLVYYLDEAIIYIVILGGIISAEAFKKFIGRRTVVWSDFTMGGPMILLSALVAFSVYGGMYTRPYSEKDKAPMAKRIAAAVIQGFTWRLMFTE